MAIVSSYCRKIFLNFPIFYEKCINNKSFKYALKIAWGLIILRLLIPYTIRIPIWKVDGTGTVNMIRNLIVNIIIKFNNFKSNLLIYNIDNILPKLNRVLVALLITFYTGYKIHRMKGHLSQSTFLENSEFINSYLEEFKVKRKIQVFVNDNIAYPVTYGIIRPKIIIQSRLLENQNAFKNVLIHEIIHIKEFDIVWNYLKNILICIYWYNPLIWLMGISLNEDIEILCDKLTVNYLGGREENKRDYCITMLSLITAESDRTILEQRLHPNMNRMMIIKNWELKKSGVFLAIFLIFVTLTAFITLEENTYPQTISSYEGNKLITNIEDRTKETTINKYIQNHDKPEKAIGKPNISDSCGIKALGGSKSYTFHMRSWLGPPSKKFVTKISNLSSEGPIDYKIIIEEDKKIIYSNSFSRNIVLITNYSRDNRKYKVTLINTSNEELNYDIDISNYKEFDEELYIIENKTYFSKNDTDIPREIYVEKDYQGQIYYGHIPIETMYYNSISNSWKVKYSGYIYPENHGGIKKGE